MVPKALVLAKLVWLIAGLWVSGYSEKMNPEVRLVAMTIMYEATGQPELGQRLVAHVVVNRWRASGEELEAVLFETTPYPQFLGWTGPRKLRWLGCTLLESEECFERYGDFEQMLRIAEEVVAVAAEPSGFRGVAYFDNPIFWNDGMPPWAEGKEFLGCVSDHCFWRDWQS